jgi:hypothetical protein
MDIFTYNYENYPFNNMTYHSIDYCISQNNNIKTDDNIVIYLINWSGGFGSALTVFMHNAYYLNNINNKLHILPMFCRNTNNFKYHDDNCNNTFFKYFKYNLLKTDIDHTYKVYYIQACHPLPLPFFTDKLPPIEYSPGNTYLRYFMERFTLCIGDKIKEYIQTIKSSGIPLIGIHIRSMYQKMVHNGGYLSKSIEQRLRDIKKTLDATYSKYNIFIATDVNKYIEYSKDVFTSIHFLDYISRINNENDSVPQLQEVGFKLGSDILYDCLALSMCDTTYVSNSNIPFIITVINPECKMIEY